MTKLEKTYETINKEKIEVMNKTLRNQTTNAFICYYDKNYCIILDKSKCNNSIEENIVLMEELGHYYTNSLYKPYNNSTLIGKMEYRAKKWQINALVPLEELRKHIGASIYELADIFNVTAEFIIKTLNFYEERGLLLEY